MVNPSIKSAASNTRRLVYFDYFRGLAILLIILGHCYNAWSHDSVMDSVLVNLISGNTALFVFISGFFFHHVYMPKYDYQWFVWHKTINVFVPYLLLSLLFMLMYYLRTGDVFMADVLQAYFGTGISQLQMVWLNILTGRTLWAYWYVPFVMLVFLLSPVFVRYLNLRISQQLLSVVLFFGLSMYVHRPSMEINPFHSMVYYVPYYLLGMVYSQHREAVNERLQQHVMLLLLITLMAAYGMQALGQTDNLGKQAILEWRGVDWMVMQKLTLIPFMLGFTLWLQRFEWPSLSAIANMSFAFYFLHQWVLYLMRDTGLLAFEHGFGGVLQIFVFVVIACYFLAITLKRVLGRRSRYLVGW